MNRRSLLKSCLTAAVASCVRWLPMPAVAEPEEPAELVVIMEWLPTPEHWLPYEGGPYRYRIDTPLPSIGWIRHKADGAQT